MTPNHTQKKLDMYRMIDDTVLKLILRDDGTKETVDRIVDYYREEGRRLLERSKESCQA